MDATAGPSSIRFGLTDPRLTTQDGLIVWPHFPRQVGFRTAQGGTPPSLIDHRHGLSSQRHHLAISGRSGTVDAALSEKSPYPGGAQARLSVPKDSEMSPKEPPGQGPISERSGTADMALSEKSPYPRSVPENANLIVLHPEASLRIPTSSLYTQKRPGECQAETVSWEPSCWLRHLPLELRCSLVRGLKHEPQRGPRLVLTSSCERILHAIAFLLTESFRLRR